MARFKATPANAKLLRGRLIQIQEQNRLTVRRGRWKCFLNHGIAKPGLTRQLTKKIFCKMQRLSHYNSCSSLGRGKNLDAAISHRVDCAHAGMCLCPTKKRLGDADKAVVDRFMNDMKTMGWVPISTQLIVRSANGDLLTAPDVTVLTPDGIGLVECKSGRHAPMDEVVHSTRKNIAMASGAPLPNTLRNRDALQAAVTARMFESTYNKRPAFVTVCYLDRLETKNGCLLEWAHVHNLPWYTPENMDKLVQKME